MDGLLERTTSNSLPVAEATPRRPHIVIVGAGFGGLTAAMHLDRADADVTVIDRRNYHLFQPLLYQVATAALSPADIAAPIRGILAAAREHSRAAGHGHRHRPGRPSGADRRTPHPVRSAVDRDRRAACLFRPRRMGIGHPGLKTIEDATAMRRRILLAFERAEDCDDEAERRRLLTFVIIGGGPTGVELAGAIAELGKARTRTRFPPDRPDDRAHRPGRGGSAPAAGVRAALVGGRGQGIDSGSASRCGSAPGQRTAMSRRRSSATSASTAGPLIWAAGVAASPAADWLDVTAGARRPRTGRPPI